MASQKKAAGHEAGRPSKGPDGDLSFYLPASPPGTADVPDTQSKAVGPGAVRVVPTEGTGIPII